MIALILVSSLWASDLCKNQVTTESVSQKIQNRLDQAPHLVHVAKLADQVLSQLTQSKSPVLLSWLEQKNLTSSKEDEIAKHWRKYYFDQFVLKKFPTPHPQVNQTVESLVKEIREQTLPIEVQKKLQSVFISAQKKLQNYLQDLSVLDESTKLKILDRLKKIKLVFIDQLRGSRFQSHPKAYLDLALDFDDSDLSVAAGPRVADFINDEPSLLSLMIYQLSQSFSPCPWSQNLLGANPFSAAIQCLKENPKILAQPRDDSFIATLLKTQRLNSDQAQKLASYPHCEFSFYQSPKIQQDEINSAFSHWITAEVMAQTHLTETFYKPFCQPQNQWPQVFGTELKDPLTKIYGAQPKIKSQWKTTASHYCPAS